VQWGINTRVTDIMRDKELLPLLPQGGPRPRLARHRGRRPAQARPVQQGNQGRENKEAIRLLREADIFVEAQFIVGLDNETPRRWRKPTDGVGLAARSRQLGDVHALALHPAVPGTGDKVEIFDFSKYNFVTPIMKPEAMDRATLLDRVMNNYRRFYMRRRCSTIPGAAPASGGSYLLGCLKAFLKAGFERKFYDLGKANYWGPQSKEEGQLQLRPHPHHRQGTDGGLASTGPNAVIQTRLALIDICGAGHARALFSEAGLVDWFDLPPDSMVSAEPVNRLNMTLFRQLESPVFEMLMADAGVRTGRYILENRIPRPVRRLLQNLPAWLAARALLKAIRAHAWTFAGNARVSIAPGHPAIIEIRSNPIAVPGCPWHRGVFETLFSGILGKPVHVDHSTLFDGQSCDRFMVRWNV
jgi:bacteriochlorophyll 4-vinyl reductase